MPVGNAPSVVKRQGVPLGMPLASVITQGAAMVMVTALVLYQSTL